MSRAAKIARLLALLAAVANLGVLAWLFLRRLGYPYDLEWMEGGMLCHSLRILDGQPLYAPPSVDFIPYLYTPLYPALIAALARITPGGVGYVMGRLVSIFSFIGASALGWRFAVRHGGSRATATAGLALPAAAWVATGAWYDIARPDSLWLLLVTAGLLLLYRAARTDGDARRSARDWRGHALAASAAALMTAAFFTKQIAFPLMFAGGLALLALQWRLAFTYGGIMALLGLPSLWLLDRASGGWFWTYIFKLHQSHAEYPLRAWVESPWTLIKILGPSLLLLPWAVARRRSPALVYIVFVAVAGAYTACLSFKTQWAFTNAFIPGVFFPSVAIATCAGALVTPGRGRSLTPLTAADGRPAPPRLRPVAVFLLLALSLSLHPFDPRPFIPTARDRAAGDALVARLRATPGEVLIPFHPFYAHLAGKPTFLHRMGVMDVNASLGTPKGLAEGLHARRWSLVVFDDKIRGSEFMWPGLMEQYVTVDRIAGPRTVSGAVTVPSLIFAPKPIIDRDLQ